MTFVKLLSLQNIFEQIRPRLVLWCDCSTDFLRKYVFCLYDTSNPVERRYFLLYEQNGWPIWFTVLSVVSLTNF